jgi:glycosyltransferase involved in cell wall biosynthesis
MELIDPDAHWVAMVARFDESKGGDKQMALGLRTKQLVGTKLAGLGRASEKVQTIFIGNGSKDDPSGVPEYERMLKLRRDMYPEDKNDIILARVKHNYEAINAFMHPPEANSGAAHIGVQMSDAEGCETRISDWIEHGVPVAASNRGGMPLQVIPKKSGIVLDYEQPDFDIERGADFISNLMVHPEKYRELSDSTKATAEAYNRREYTTTANVTRQLRAFARTLAGQSADKTWKIRDMEELDSAGTEQSSSFPKVPA